MCESLPVSAPVEVLDDLRDSLDSLPRQLRERLVQEIRFVLIELSHEQDAFMTELAS